METKEYKTLGLITEADNHGHIMRGRFNPVLARIVHAHLGLSSETGEIGDAIKKHLAYGQKLDRNNLIEEAGDILWYLNLLLDALNSDIGEAMDLNIAKLKKRYPEGFSEEYAKKRLDKQRSILC